MEDRQTKLNLALLDAVRWYKIDPLKVQKLVELGADVNVKGNNRKTPLIYLCDRNEAELVRFMVENGADVSAKDTSDANALMHCCYDEYHKDYDKCIDMVKALLEHGADINEICEGSTALDYIMGNEECEGKQKAIRFFRGNGAKTYLELENENQNIA